MNAFHARGPLQVPGLGAGPFDLVFEGNYADRVVNATHYEVTHRPPAATSKARARSRPPRTAPNYCCTATGAGCAGRWRRASRAETPQIFSSPEGKYRLEGLWPYAIAASGDLFIPQLDPMTVAMRGALHKDHLQIDELDLGAFGGTAQLAGEARWTPEESWALEGSVKGFNPATLRPGFTGALDFNIKASGAPFGADGDLDFAFSNLTGQAARQHAPPAAAACMLHGDDWTFDKLRFRAGNTSLAIDGEHRRIARARTSTSASTPTTSRCWPKARAASCMRAARSAARPTRRSSSSTRRATASRTGRSSVDKLAANIDLDWRGQRDFARRHRHHAARSRRARAHAVQRHARWHDRRSHASRPTRSPARPACTCPARAASPMACGKERSATCSSTTPPTSICSSTRRSS